MQLFKTLLLICYLVSTSAEADAVKELAEFHLTIVEKFDKVAHIEAASLESMESSDLVIFDVRESDEFAVSHLPGAIRVSPDISRDSFLKHYADITGGKTSVFYCSVGYRSSALAEDVQRSLSSPVYNLVGGIFNWHNQHREVVNHQGTTDAIHPYNQYWGRFLSRQEEIRF